MLVRSGRGRATPLRIYLVGARFERALTDIQSLRGGPASGGDVVIHAFFGWPYIVVVDCRVAL